MKLFDLLHWSAIIVGSLGVAALFGAWWLLFTGKPIEIFGLAGLSEVYFYNNAFILFLAAIWLMLGAFWHKWAGK